MVFGYALAVIAIFITVLSNFTSARYDKTKSTYWIRSHVLNVLKSISSANVAAAQNGELHIPLESDNQFPPEEHAETVDSPIEGSGEGAVSEPADTTTEIHPIPKIEDVKSPVLSDNETEPSTSESNVSPTSETADGCPKPCVCNIEGDTKNFIVDCSGYGLTEFPKVIDPRTTNLNLQNNKLTEIPKEISDLKNLKVLNANNNQIMELAPGVSIKDYFKMFFFFTIIVKVTKLHFN